MKRLSRVKSLRSLTNAYRKYHSSLSTVYLTGTLSVLSACPAMANFSSIFVTKLNTVRDQLVIVGKAAMLVSLVWAVIMFAFNRDPNWRRIATLAGVGAALVSIDQLYTFFQAA